MSYITSKLISVNYVRTVFRLRKSDQFTFNPRFSQLKIIAAGYPRVITELETSIWHWTSGTNGFGYVTDLKARKTIYHKQIPFNNESIEFNYLKWKAFLENRIIEMELEETSFDFACGDSIPIFPYGILESKTCSNKVYTVLVILYDSYNMSDQFDMNL